MLPKASVDRLVSLPLPNQPTHLLPPATPPSAAVPDANACIMRKCSVFPVEFVCRGFLTGSTDTSLWTHYKAGARDYCGNSFPDGMNKNDRLAQVLQAPSLGRVVGASTAARLPLMVETMTDWRS